jgi:hypothetical protein
MMRAGSDPPPHYCPRCLEETCDCDRCKGCGRWFDESEIVGDHLCEQCWKKRLEEEDDGE